MMNDAASADAVALRTANTPDVVVCVPTYRRPAQLARLLRALAAQRDAPPFEILVGNNEDRDLSTYDALADPTLPAFRTIRVETRGVSAVRNAMIAEVLATQPQARWIACLDDDQIPQADWLHALVDCGERYDADLGGGPVTRSVGAPTFWSHGASDTSYLPRKEGPMAMLNEAGNLLLSTCFLRSLERPPFSLEFGRTGGEDYEFFLHARSRGARIVWAPDARVDEPLPQDRLTWRSYVWRFYAIAAYQARADRLYLGTWHVVRMMAREFAKGAWLVGRSLWRRSLRDAIGAGVQYASCVAGRLVGLVGVRAERYARNDRPARVGAAGPASAERR